MKVLHINSYYILAPLYKNLYDEQVDSGLDIDVYVPINEKYKEYNKELGNYSLKDVVFNDLDRLFFYRKHKKIFKAIDKKYVVRNYNLIHAHSLFSNGYIAYKLNKKYGIPYIVAVRNTDVNVFFKRMYHLRKLGQKIMANASKVVFISEPYKEHVISKYLNEQYIEIIKAKCEVIPNGINRFWIENAQRKESSCIDDKSLNVICVGDIDKNKNHITTLEALKILVDKGYNVSFTIVGRILEKEIYSQIIKYEFVNYRGTMKKEDLLLEYRNNDFFVMPSYTETFGLVYAEAMSQGVPVIYSRNQGFDGQFAEGTIGYSVDANNPGEIAEKLLLIKNNYSAISNQCVNSIDRFNWEHITEEYADIYNQIVE